MPTVLITGAGRGIGLELARAYRAEGWAVIGTVRSVTGAEPLAATGARVETLDVTSDGAVAALAAALDGAVLDLVINNAGVAGWNRIDETTLDAVDLAVWHEVLEVNTLAPFRVARAFRQSLARAPRPVLATLSSRLGSLSGAVGGSGLGGMYAYRSSKAAVNMVTLGLAADLRPLNIACVVLHPGWVQTDMGGRAAPVAPADSARGLKRVLDGVTLADSGRFLDWQGAEISW